MLDLSTNNKDYKAIVDDMLNSLSIDRSNEI